MATRVDKLRTGAPLPIASTWSHSTGELIKVNHQWTIHQYELRGPRNQLDSTTFSAFDKTNAVVMTWNLTLDDKGVTIGEKSMPDSQTSALTPFEFTQSIRVTSAFVNRKGECMFTVKDFVVREREFMPVRINATAREAILQKSNQLLIDGNLTFVCNIEAFKRMPNLMGQTAKEVGKSLNHTSQLLSNFKVSLFEDKMLSDVTINIQGHPVEAHKIILAARSPVFAAMFQHPTKEKSSSTVDVPDIEPEVFQELLRYIYTGHVPFDSMDKVAAGLLVAADKYLLDELKQACKNRLENNISPQNCVKLLSLVDENDPAYFLREKAVDFIRQFPAKVMATDSWKSAAKENPAWIVAIKEMLLATLV